jgi:leucyl-tRNA---protein transferase
MFCQVVTPESLTPGELDDHLSKGWFRMGQNIFTTNFLNFKNQFYSALWLRVRLTDYVADGTEVKLRKLNSRFSVTFKPAEITDEQEELFARYRQNLSFEASASLHQLLYGKALHNVFNTWEVSVRDEGRLIACGFFDLGQNTAAGISSFYDPTFRKYSLGKYLIYLKMSFCLDHGMEYFYPGYFVPGYSFFDYKLSIGKRTLEYLDVVTDRWQPIAGFSPLLIPIRIMQEKLGSLQIDLAQRNIPCDLYRYEFFEANLLPELKDVGLFDFPLFIHQATSDLSALVVVIVYDIRTREYHLVRCRSLWNSNLPNNKGMYSEQLLKEERTIVSSDQPIEIIEAYIGEINNPYVV